MIKARREQECEAPMFDYREMRQEAVEIEIF